MPRYIGRLAYPVYYSDLIVPAAQQYGQDPLYLFSIIRQESFFGGFATSFAYAQGLMQIIPATGEEIATKLNWPDYQNEDLYRPYVSVTFGTYYLNQQSTLFDGDLFAAMSAYNAGAGRVLDWKAVSGNDPDLFVETIPINETFNYVTRIYVNYNIYRTLYGSGS